MYVVEVDVQMQTVDGATGQIQDIDQLDDPVGNPVGPEEQQEGAAVVPEAPSRNDLQENDLGEFKVPACIKPPKDLDDNAVYEAEELGVYRNFSAKLDLENLTDSEIETMELVTQKREQQLIREEVIVAMNERQLINLTIPIGSELTVSFHSLWTFL